jgi:hypothetical protein
MLEPNRSYLDGSFTAWRLILKALVRSVGTKGCAPYVIAAHEEV